MSTVKAGIKTWTGAAAWRGVTTITVPSGSIATVTPLTPTNPTLSILAFAEVSGTTLTITWRAITYAFDEDQMGARFSSVSFAWIAVVPDP